MPLLKPNALAATQGSPAASGGGPMDVVGNIEAAWKNANAQHSKLLESAKRLDVMRAELDSLMKLGDSVEVEEVIEGAGKLVGAGMGADEVAGLLAQMPTQGGEALAGWIKQQDQAVRMGEQQMKQQLKTSAIHRGLTAFAHLHMQHQMEGLKAAQVKPGGPSVPAPQTQTEDGGEDAQSS